MKTPVFTGSSVAIVTPFYPDGSVNYDKLKELIDFHIENGTSAITICGTTGESATMTIAEHVEVIDFTVKYANKRSTVIAGSGSNDTMAALEISKEAEKSRADALLMVTPYYNKATQGGLIQHFGEVARAIDIPVILYNVPSRTGCNIMPETAVRLCREYDNIVGIKDATGVIAQTSRMMQLADGCIDLYSGNDDEIVPIMSLGGLGVISVLSNVAPRQTHDICAKCLEGDFAAARELQFKALPLVKALFSEVNPIPVKSALKMIGFEAGPLRPPLTEMEEKNQEILRQEMKNYGLIK